MRPIPRSVLDVLDSIDSIATRLEKEQPPPSKINLFWQSCIYELAFQARDCRYELERAERIELLMGSK